MGFHVAEGDAPTIVNSSVGRAREYLTGGNLVVTERRGR